MYRETLTLGVVPNKRSFLSMVEAKRQKWDKAFWARGYYVETIE